MNCRVTPRNGTGCLWLPPRFTRTAGDYGSLRPQARRRNSWTMGTSNALENFRGTIALAGAGKMGGAVLTGWLAQGLDPARAIVIEPHPSAEIKAMAGIRLNPAPNETGEVDTLVVAVKPQSFREAAAALKPF